MTEREQHAVAAMPTVQEYSDNEHKIAMLECRLRRLGKLMREQGTRLENDLRQVTPSDVHDLAEVRQDVQSLERALDTRRRLEIDLRKMDLAGLIRTD